MKSKNFILVSYFTAVLIGFVSAFVICVWPLKLEEADNVVAMCEGDLITLNLVKSGDVSELVKRKENRLVIFAKLLSSEYADHPGSAYFLWEIQDYFKSKTNGVPADLQQYFEKLPVSKPMPRKLYYRGN